MDSSAEFQSILTFTDQLFWWMGYKIFDGLWDTKYRRVHRYITILLFSILPFLAIHFLIQNISTPLQSRVDLVMCISSSVIGIFKMIFLHLCHKDLVILFQTSCELRVKYFQDENSSTLINRYTKIKSVLRGVRSLNLASGIFYITLPLLNGGYKEHQLPFTFELPFVPLDGTGYYLIHYAYHFYAVWCVVIFTGVDAIVLLSISEACLQLDLLSKRLRTLGRVHEGRSLELEPNNLRTNHNHHVDCLSYINSVKNLYGKLVLVQFTIDCLLLCTLLYSAVKSDMTKLPTTVTCLIVVLVQLFIYCICGQVMTDKVHDLTTAIYDSEWYNLSLKDRKSLIIIMSRTQEEVYISAMGFNLSLENFVAVMKTAYSYYTIIRGMDA